MNYWAMFSFVAGILNLSLGIYVFFKGPRRPLNRIFTLFAFSLVIWCITEFGHRIVLDPEWAYLWIKIGGFGWCFMASLCAHFILVFARQEKILKNIFTYIGLYGPPSVILLLFLTTNLIYKQEPVKMYFGYTVLPGRFVWTYISYSLLLYIPVIYFLVEIIRKSTILEKKQAKPILIGSTFFLILGTSSNVIFPVFKISGPELGTTFSVVWAVSVFYAVLKHKLFILKPSTEELMGTPEKYALKMGLSYHVNEERPDRGYEIFYDQITHGKSGLCITKLAPGKVRERYKLIKTPVLWLTFKNVKDAISPKDIDGLTSVVSDFVRGAEKSLLFLDCFDQIKFANGFEKSLSMLKDFRKLCNESSSNLLLSINPAMFEKSQVSTIEKELEEVG